MACWQNGLKAIFLIAIAKKRRFIREVMKLLVTGGPKSSADARSDKLCCHFNPCECLQLHERTDGQVLHIHRIAVSL